MDFLLPGTSILKYELPTLFMAGFKVSSGSKVSACRGVVVRQAWVGPGKEAREGQALFNWKRAQHQHEPGCLAFTEAQLPYNTGR